MGKTIQVTSAQVNAARLWIERADRDGTPIPEAIRKLANAAPRPVILRETTPTAMEAPNGNGPADPPTGRADADADAEHLDGSR